MLQLGAMIGGEPASSRPAPTMAIQTASTREAETWHFTVEGEEELQLPGGEWRALKLTRSPRTGIRPEGRTLARSRAWITPRCACV